MQTKQVKGYIPSFEPNTKSDNFFGTNLQIKPRWVQHTKPGLKPRLIVSRVLFMLSGSWLHSCWEMWGWDSGQQMLDAAGKLNATTIRCELRTLSSFCCCILFFLESIEFSHFVWDNNPLLQTASIILILVIPCGTI